MDAERLKVPIESLSKRCDPEGFDFETTNEVPPLEGMIGQERAFSAMELGLNVQEPGYNLFISGPPGTGRNTALKVRVQQAATQKSIPPDWGYVYNFQDPSQPIPISLPCGQMRIFAADTNELIDSVQREIPQVFESDEYTERMEAAMQSLEAARQEKTAAMEKSAAEAGFLLRPTPAGISTVAMRNGQPISPEEFAAMPQEEQAAMRQRATDLQHEINRTMADIRRLGKSAGEEAREVDKEIVRYTLTPIIDELQEKYAPFPDVVAHLDRVETDMVEHLDAFKPKDPRVNPFAEMTPDEDPFLKYRVNDLIDNAECDFAPIVFEQNPTYYNLFGRIDYQARIGMLYTNHMMIKGGAIHEANGGYLVLQAHELLANPLSWQTLKRILQSREIRIENMGEHFSPIPSSTLRPKPIPVDAKIIIVGTPDILHLLRVFDQDFPRYFKVNAEFDTQIDRTPENVAKYVAFLSSQHHDRKLRPLHKTAVAKIIEYSSRLAEDQRKLTTRFIHLSDIVTEANYWANVTDEGIVTAEHVVKAIEQRRYRASMTEDRIQELIEDGTIRISTDGKAVGQVNGLAVLAIGEASFGKPSRITARVSLGRGQFINVERESKMSGNIHDKGFMALTGYLKGKYGYNKPLSMNASISFEQSYSEVDGDSASSTELYALLSAIARLPIDQGMAVTGSVNQNGDVQAVGGVTQKIEGFFQVCKAKGLTHKQGVIIPRDNLRHLTLNDEVLEAIQNDEFHVFAVSTIDEGLEILTGIPAEEQLENGEYPQGTVHYKVEQRLMEMAQTAQEFTPSGEQQER